MLKRADYDQSGSNSYSNKIATVFSLYIASLKLYRERDIPATMPEMRTVGSRGKGKGSLNAAYSGASKRFCSFSILTRKVK